MCICLLNRKLAGNSRSYYLIMNNKLTLKDSLQSPTNSFDASSDSPLNKANNTLLDPRADSSKSSIRMGREVTDEVGGEKGQLNFYVSVDGLNTST